MSNEIEYRFSLIDEVSAKMDSITIKNEKMLDLFGGLQMKLTEVNRTFNDTGETLGSLKQKVDFLQQEREWIPVSNMEGLQAYNSKIKELNDSIRKLEGSNVDDIEKLGSAFGDIHIQLNQLNCLHIQELNDEIDELDTPKIEQTGKEIDKLDGEKKGGLGRWLDKIKAGIPALTKMLSPLNLLTEARKRLNDAVKDGLVQWDLQYNAETQFSTAMQNSMQAGQEQTDSILKLSKAQQKLGVISQHIQLSGANSLATTVTEPDSLEKLLPLMNDLLAKQHGINATQDHAAAIAGALGKVMKGEADGLSAYGITLTEAQQTLLQFGNEAARVAVLEEAVRKAAGGANEALTQTPEGRWKQHENGVNALLARIGKLTVQFRNSLFPVIEVFGNLFEKVIVWIEGNSATIAAAVQKVCSVAAVVLEGVFSALSGIIEGFTWWFTALQEGNPFVVTITTNVGLLVGVLGGLFAISKAVALYQGIQATATGVLTAAQWALNSAFLASPLTWIVLAIGAVVAVVMVCWNRFENFRKVVFGVWNVIQEFGAGLQHAILNPIRQIIDGIGMLGRAIGQLFEGDFDGAWESAKEGAAELATGLISANPFGVGVNVIRNGDWSGAWEKGQQEGAESWQQSQEEGDGGFNVSDLLASFGLTDMPGHAVSPELSAPTVVPGLQLSESKWNQLPESAEPARLLSQSQHSQNESFLEDIMLNVRKIAAIVTLPVALSAAQPETGFDLTGQPAAYSIGTGESYLGNTQGGDGKTVYVDRICEQIVIHVANTDHRGTEEIRSAIYEVLNEIAEA